MRGLLFLLSFTCAGALSAQDFTTLKGHGGPIMDIAVSHSGQVATASFDNAIGLWTDRSPHWLDGHEAAVTTVTHGPNGTVFSGGDDFTVRQWTETTSRVLGKHTAKVTGLALSPDGSTLASSSWDGTVKLWPLTGDTPATTIKIGSTGVNDVSFAPDGNTIFTATNAGQVLGFATHAPQRNLFPLVNHGFGVNQLIAGDGWITYGAVDGGTRVIDPNGKQIADFTLDRRPILSMSYHEDSNSIAVGDGHGFIMMIDTANWRITHDFRATRRGPVWALDFSPDGAMLYAGGLDDVAYGWPVNSLADYDPAIKGDRSFLRAAASMPNGERQFMRKCSICHALQDGPSRKAGPTLHGIFGRPAGTLEGYRYSDILEGSDIIWNEHSIDALFHEGPDHYIPGSKMPMQVIAKATDRADLITFLKRATAQGDN